MFASDDRIAISRLALVVVSAVTLGTIPVSADEKDKPRVFKSSLSLIVNELIDGSFQTRGTTGPTMTKGIALSAGAEWVVQPIGMGNFGGFGFFGGAVLAPGPKGKKMPGVPAGGFGAVITGDSLKTLTTEMKKHAIPGVHLQAMRIGADDFGTLLSVPGLKTLILGAGTDITDEHLDQLVKAKELRTFAVTGTHRITDVGVAKLTRIATLRRLQLVDPVVTDKTMELLKEMPHLTALRLTQTHVQAAGLASLRSLPKLETLELIGGYTDTELKELCALPALRVLRLAGTGITQDGLEHLARCEKLEVLTLDGHWHLQGLPTPSGRTAEGRINWPFIPSHFGFGGGFGLVVGKEMASVPPQFRGPGLEQLTQLKELHLINNKLKDADLAHVEKLTGLKRLTIFAPEVGDAGLAHLSKLKALETLDLRGTAATTKVVASLRGLGNLQMIKTNIPSTDTKAKAMLTTWRTAFPRAKVQSLEVNHISGFGMFGPFGP